MTTQQITDKLHLRLSEMQTTVIDAILQGHANVLLLSPTGSGKTLAYLIPLAQLIDATTDSLQALVILPGRELAIQSCEVFRSMGTGLRAYACHGGRPTMDEHLEMRRLKPQIVFATPGRMVDHLDKGNIDASSVKTLVIDEYDKCLQLGFEKEMTAVIGHLPTQLRKILLSATMPADNVSSIFSEKDFTVFNFISSGNSLEERLKVAFVRSPDKDKLPTLARLLCSLHTTCSIVFLNYRESVERTAAYLQRQGFAVSSYHGGLDQQQREEALYAFANHSTTILVCTDLGSRGLDITDVENVIHYHLPETREAYIHRIGRTARWQSSGRVFFILSDDEQIPDYAGDDIEEYKLPDAPNVSSLQSSNASTFQSFNLSFFQSFNAPAAVAAPLPPKMKTLYIGKGRKNKISKGDIVGFLCHNGSLTAAQIGRIDVYDYYSLAAVERKAAASAIRKANGMKIKGQKTKVEEKR